MSATQCPKCRQWSDPKRDQCSWCGDMRDPLYSQADLDAAVEKGIREGFEAGVLEGQEYESEIDGAAPGTRRYITKPSVDDYLYLRAKGAQK